MKHLVFICLIWGSLMSSAIAEATPAQAFRGLYPLAEADGVPVAPDSEYVLVDADVLHVIWAKYASGDLPESLEQYRDEPVIIAGFTHRDFVVLAFEAFSMVTDRYLRLSGGDDQRFELFRQDDGKYRVGTIKNGSNNIYLTNSPLPLDTKIQPYDFGNLLHYRLENGLDLIEDLHYK